MAGLKKRKLDSNLSKNGDAVIKRKKRSPEVEPSPPPVPDSNEESDFSGVDSGAEEEEQPTIPSTDGGSDVAKDAAVAPCTFEDLGIIDSLCEACESLGYKAPTPIQAESIPPALQGRDLIGLAETGSGKTAAFALPILQALMDKPQALFGLVLAPTRELADQIGKQFEALGSLIAVKCAVLVGGMDMVTQAIALAKKPHIIVATPGRLLDHLQNTKGFSLRTLKYLVMDEADRLLDLDFGPILDKILRVLPRDRRTYLFSATMSSKVESLQRASLSNPLRISISSSSYQTVATLLQSYSFIPHKHKDIYLVSLLSDHMGQSTILFTRTVHETQRLAFLLRALGFGAIPLHGQLSQDKRLGALNKFKAHSRDILVATDVAARGLDIPSVDLVVNYDLPTDSKTYVHRVGRTARAGKSGMAISLVTQYDVEVYLRIEKALGRKLDEKKMIADEVMVYADKVSEAQRVAIREIKDFDEKKKARGKGGLRHRGGARGAGRDNMDAEEG
ncbi:putative ATP-dependent RNA helicase [Elsinoe ampelina]|uniref:ATP-dependent rRNA helicase RRP3 n=1 Tax=Elsinoe ampelina TaxID=302913 RepID=A0A6A6GLH4_9PEZI|nr:putative ATP-dependent RNA helicase [Elsinoe ampelina]